jgi:hypothetical protein
MIEKKLTGIADAELLFTATGNNQPLAGYHHTVAVDDDCTSFSVDIRIGGRWVRPDGCTDVDASDGDGKANVVNLRQIGFDAVRVTIEDAGSAYLCSYKDPR